jgi:N-acetylglutamate synthase-like GNAT family acetyltransferase
METDLNSKKIEIHFSINENEIYCDQGKLEFSFEDDAVIINSLSVYSKRNHIGTKLVGKLENVAFENELKIIEVPASPTKEAILFWRSLGFKPSIKDDKYWVKRIIRSDKDDSWDIPQGVVVMKKMLQK